MKQTKEPPQADDTSASKSQSPKDSTITATMSASDAILKDKANSTLAITKAEKGAKPAIVMPNFKAMYPDQLRSTLTVANQLPGGNTSDGSSPALATPNSTMNSKDVGNTLDGPSFAFANPNSTMNSKEAPQEEDQQQSKSDPIVCPKESADETLANGHGMTTPTEISPPVPSKKISNSSSQDATSPEQIDLKKTDNDNTQQIQKYKLNSVAPFVPNGVDVDAQETDLAPAAESISNLVDQDPVSERTLKRTTATPSMVYDDVYGRSPLSTTTITLVNDEPATVHSVALANIQPNKRKSDKSPVLQYLEKPEKRRKIYEDQESPAIVIVDDPKNQLIEEVYIEISESHIAFNIQNHAALRDLFSDWVSPERVRAGELGGYVIIFPESENRVERTLKCFEHFKTRRFENELIPMKVFLKNILIARFDGRAGDWVGDELLASI